MSTRQNKSERDETIWFIPLGPQVVLRINTCSASRILVFTSEVCGQEKGPHVKANNDRRYEFPFQNARNVSLIVSMPYWSTSKNWEHFYSGRKSHRFDKQ
jgi:hypothetical protein